ncbi:hemerythrin domain-containing protein [Nocardioides sp. zg-1308]|uniref:hemerythrin domain-containing protein n=1 Tax=Nocardioides sp. zg-1308 TaxID=2736253 RepID=UPI001556D019|nr:hemerythrin domain-containing protein [Nocardioides sp. zg-1308]
MAEGDTTRLVAWAHEMRSVHDRLRAAHRVAQDEVGQGRAPSASRDLLLFCRGFCTALDGHHRGEDTILFPAVAAEHPDLAEPLRTLVQDHAIIGHLVGALRAAVDAAADPATLGRHLDGIGAIMESHFRYEERTLLGLLERLELTAPVTQVLGPL